MTKVKLPSKIQKNSTPFLVIFGVAIVGSLWLVFSHAQTPTASITASSSTLNGCATKVTDTNASSGSAVKFTTCTNSTNPAQLDASGATIPDSNYSIPAGAIFMAPTGSDSNAGSQAAPVKTINHAVALVAAGGTIVMRGGNYRDWYNSGGSFGVITKVVTIQAYPHEQPWFDGADQVTAWTSDGAGHWYTTNGWTTTSFCNGQYYNMAYNAQTASGPCTHNDMYYADSSKSTTTAAGDPQMVFINGTQSHEVTSLAAATSGNFYYDMSAKRLYIGDNPSGKTVELAARPMAMQLNGTGSKVLGIGFKRFASNEYNNNTGVVVYAGAPSQTYENLTFTQHAGGAIGLYGSKVNQVINHSVFAYNGFDGIQGNGNSSSGSADGALIENNVMNHNNNELFGPGCTASCSQAGMKLSHMVGFTVTNNIVENNVGAQGLWCDLNCSNSVYVYNTVINNGQNGILHEVSNTGIIASNLIADNGYNGVTVASANTKVYNNTFVNNGALGPYANAQASIWVYDDSRLGGGVGPDTTALSIANNVFESPRLMNTAQGTSATQTQPSTAGFFALLGYNSFWRTAGAGGDFWRWQTSSGTVGPYTTIASFQSAHGSTLETNSTDDTSSTDPFFVNAAGGDYTIKSGSTAYHSGTAIPADVMSALGISTGTGLSRGVISWPH